VPTGADGLAVVAKEETRLLLLLFWSLLKEVAAKILYVDPGSIANGFWNVTVAVEPAKIFPL
jgi:hypothetical protein